MVASIAIVIPAYQERESLARTIVSIFETCYLLDFELVIVVDSNLDSSVKIVEALIPSHPTLRVIVQNNQGPLSAIKFGIENTVQSHIIVLTADDTDDVRDILKMAKCFESGSHYVTASRYIDGGEYSGGPKLKRLFSRTASKILELRHGKLASDPTNGFKGFSRELYINSQIRGNVGFTYGLQLLAYAIRSHAKLSAIPTTWHDRIEGASSFKMLKWMPSYVYWFIKVLFVQKNKKR